MEGDAPHLHGRFEAPDGARDRLATRVAALRQPATYPENPDEIEAIETHMSWVFLTDEHAYKLKKPIRTDRIDCTTRSRRRRACERELRLNRRLAESVYLDVVPLTRPDHSLRVGGEGDPVDWLVKMRRLSRDHMLDEAIRAGTVRRDTLRSLTSRLVEFYRTARSPEWSGPYYRKRLQADIEEKCRLLRKPRYGLDEPTIAAILHAQRDWLSDHGELMEARVDAVVDAHGDLRPEHVALEEPPVVIDCLEFDRKLRLLDPVSELSFLALECRRLGADWIEEELFAGYQEGSGDRFRADLVAFYQAQHALIRATLAVWHLDDNALSDSAPWLEKADWYLEVACELTGVTSSMTD